MLSAISMKSQLKCVWQYWTINRVDVGTVSEMCQCKGWCVVGKQTSLLFISQLIALHWSPTTDNSKWQKWPTKWFSAKYFSIEPLRMMR